MPWVLDLPLPKQIHSTGFITLKGDKISKSKSNGFNPRTLTDRYGADALRFMLASSVSPGNDMRFSEEKITAARNFCNKIWNAARFILMNDVSEVKPDYIPEDLKIEDRWILYKLSNIISEVTDNLDKYELGIAANKVYDFACVVWQVQHTSHRKHPMRNHILY